MLRLVSFLLVFCAITCSAQVSRKRVIMLMGGKFEITLVAKDTLTAERNIDTCIAEISRIERLISDWKPASQVSEINRFAGIRPVKVDKEVIRLTQTALALSHLTNGAFDISFAAMEKIWKFDGSMTTMPSTAAIKHSVEKVGYRYILVDSVNSTIFLQKKGMKIGFGALGEGYAADRCRDLMIAHGVKAGLVNGTGDMRSWGRQPDGRDWLIGITNPFHPDTILAVVPLKSGAVVTSGSYEKFALINGKRYAHIINPKTGYPAIGLCSVTIFGPSAERANGYSTSMMVLGQQAALKFIKKFPGYTYVVITDKGEVLASKSLKIRRTKVS